MTANKYHAVRVPHDDHAHDSKRERDRCFTLTMLQERGDVRNLQRQVTYRLAVGGVHICDYRADFVYEARCGAGLWNPVTEDVKGVRTPTYRLKAKLMLACLGIKVKEV